MKLVKSVTALFTRHLSGKGQGDSTAFVLRGERASTNIVSQEAISKIILEKGTWEVLPDVLDWYNGQVLSKYPSSKTEPLLGYVELNNATVEFSIEQEKGIQVISYITVAGHDEGHFDFGLQWGPTTCHIAGGMITNGPIDSLDAFKKAAADSIAGLCRTSVELTGAVFSLLSSTTEATSNV